MKIHLSTTVWHGNFHGFLIDAFRSLGCDVVFFDEGGSPLDKFFQRAATRLPRLHYAAFDVTRRKVSSAWVRSVERAQPDRIVLMDYAWNILPSAIKEVKKSGRKVIYWVTSPPLQGGAKDVLASIKFSDTVYTIDPQWMPPLLFEKRDFTFLPLAGSPEVFRPLSNPKKEYDVAFVGGFAPQSWDGFIRAYAVSRIPEKYNVAVFGKGVDYWFNYFPILRSRAKFSGTLSFPAVNRIYNASRIVLNLHSTSHTASFSARTFEIALAGAFQIVDNVNSRYNADALFPARTLQSFGTVGEMNRLIDSWLARDTEREESAVRTREIARARHTWEQRARALLETP